MEIVLRPVSDRFFQEAVLPVLTHAMGNAALALEALSGILADEQSRFLCEQLISAGAHGGLSTLEPESWAELVDRLVFLQWSQGEAGWEVAGQRAGYAGDWDEALHLAMMVESPDYPYAHAREARAERDAFRLKPRGDMGLASLVAGVWEPFPDFPPDQIFSTQGRGEYVPRDRFAFADWAWRPGGMVAQWNQSLPRKLERLLTREQERLKLTSLPEREELLAYWSGKATQPPPLAVVFSGLGPRAPGWIQEIGVITGHVREAAQEHTALVSLVTKGVEMHL
ncbi:hypothetical protein [Hyalangium rubrum]|uniref:Uncharacterized protein n=1 Tax=Hyalangium rubrum TaxID=3103134 RepID=A0ABU5H0S4_9BACT|nr:hypothetical protein [Hyalangium sp. s54d21]MDY7226916.1 hypothetical protein [Hyalangium sp. s54d21]